MIVEFFNGLSFSIGAVVGIVVCVMATVGMASLYEAIKGMLN